MDRSSKGLEPASVGRSPGTGSIRGKKEKCDPEILRNEKSREFLPCPPASFTYDLFTPPPQQRLLIMCFESFTRDTICGAMYQTLF